MLSASEKNSRWWLEDGDPLQNNALALNALKEQNSEILPILPRSPEINPIKIFF